LDALISQYIAATVADSHFAGHISGEYSPGTAIWRQRLWNLVT